MAQGQDFKTAAEKGKLLVNIFNDSPQALNRFGVDLFGGNIGTTKPETLLLDKDDFPRFIALTSNDEKFEYSGTDVVAEKAYTGKVTFLTLQKKDTHVTSILIETSTDGVTYDTRADLAALNAITEALDNTDVQVDYISVRITITRDAGYTNGFTTVFTQSAPLKG